MSEIIEVINGGSMWLLLLSAPNGILEVPVDHRMMAHIIEGEGLDNPHDLRRLTVDVTNDGIIFPDAMDDC